MIMRTHLVYLLIGVILCVSLLFLNSSSNALVTNSPHVTEPTFYNEAASDPLWIEVMHKEHQVLNYNNTWDIIDLPISKKLIGSKNAIDYLETFSSVIKMPTMRCIFYVWCIERITHFPRNEQVELKNIHSLIHFS